MFRPSTEPLFPSPTLPCPMVLWVLFARSQLDLRLAFLGKCFPVGSIPFAVAIFPVGPGVPIFHPAPVMSSAPEMYFRDLIIAFDLLPDRYCWCLYRKWWNMWTLRGLRDRIIVRIIVNRLISPI